MNTQLLLEVLGVQPHLEFPVPLGVQPRLEFPVPLEDPVRLEFLEVLQGL